MAAKEAPPDNGLFDLQLRVARRADELARARGEAAGLNLHCWLLAEREVLNRRSAGDPEAAAQPAAPGELPQPATP